MVNERARIGLIPIRTVLPSQLLRRASATCQQNKATSSR
jgi:hypothetical protein